MKEQERTILVGVYPKQSDTHHFDERMNELEALVETAGGIVTDRVTQAMDHPRNSTYIGKGKLEELAGMDADLIVFNAELTPSQLQSITSSLDVPVIDRTQLILDIFASRARSKEGKLQVELAQLSYTLPRLRGQGQVLSRLGGGIGTRGPGETKLETDQRHIRRRMTELRRRIEEVSRHREQYRNRRKENQAFQLALIGYTNAGKSTLLNELTDAGVLMEDKLFATLDPTTKKIQLPSGFECLITDTVGFIEQLPTTLIAAFRSTLEEAKEADLLLHVVDASHPESAEHEKAVMEVLRELKADTIPMLTIYNKRDLMEGTFIASSTKGPSMLVSAKDKDDQQDLLQRIQSILTNQFEPYISRIPASEGHRLFQFKRETIVTYEHFDEETEKYEIRGYAPKESALYTELMNRKDEMT
ncbi:GTPase HflX [Alkalicoccus urumqiensis]|uniref:GTPase HflX n=1 Tax=Alkalicoccus urumqiensis TaxID=1548213 RepID=A0A2P6MFU0_ALKUR|nr:GTPase HflX [Alkalicoccus urumqiensis]PRO65156.1 GTPase HflX [Alkalicoccus urumqiensis]